MANKDLDDREYWEDDSRCIVCKASMGKSQALVCSATCEDIWLLKGQNVFGRLLDEQYETGENDCYA